jgi:hypothetical protein
VSWHWLRHANATLLDAVGTPLGTLQALLGHWSSEITREVYLHSIPADARKAVEKVEDEALDMKCPVEVYQPSPRPYTGLPDIDYPLHDKTIVVTRCGRICLGKKKINFSQVFAGQAVGIKEVHDDIWLVSFMDYDLGYFDLETRVLEPLENPFGPKVLPMS